MIFQSCFSVCDLQSINLDPVIIITQYDQPDYWYLHNLAHHKLTCEPVLGPCSTLYNIGVQIHVPHFQRRVLPLLACLQYKELHGSVKCLTFTYK